MANRFNMPYGLWFNGNGTPSAGWKLYFYEGTASGSGTTTPKPTYSNYGLSIENANPVVADSNGKWPSIFLTNGFYNVVLTEPDGSPLSPYWSANPVDGGGLNVGAISTVATIADMKALPLETSDDGSVIYVESYYDFTDGNTDGGGGFFVYSATSAATADDGLVFTPDTASGRFVRQFQGNYRLDWWGAPVSASELDAAPFFNTAFASVKERGGGYISVTNGRNYALMTGITMLNCNGVHLCADSYGGYGGGNPPLLDWQGASAATVITMESCITSEVSGLRINLNDAYYGIKLVEGGTQINSQNILTWNCIIISNTSQIGIWNDADNSSNGEFMRYEYNYILSFNSISTAIGIGIKLSQGNFNAHWHIMEHNNFSALAQGISDVVGGVYMKWNNFTANNTNYYAANTIWPVVDMFADSEYSYIHANLVSGYSYRLESSRLSGMGSSDFPTKGWITVVGVTHIAVAFCEMDNSSGGGVIFDVSSAAQNNDVSTRSNACYDPSKYIHGYSVDPFDFSGAFFRGEDDYPLATFLGYGGRGTIYPNAMRASIVAGQFGIVWTAVEGLAQYDSGNLTLKNIQHGIVHVQNGATINTILYAGNLSGVVCSGSITLIADGNMTLATGGNIQLSGNTTYSQGNVQITYDGNTDKWYPPAV